jgi:very-short-patch-repair endonuclease
VPVTDHESSPLVGEGGRGPAASAAEKTFLCAEQPARAARSAPPPYPPHKGEGLKRLALPSDAIERARGLRKRMTKAERVLWRALREALPVWHWRKQVPLGPYYADFASHSAKLIIELDGGQHADAAAYDAERTKFLEAEGYRVLRFWNNDALANTGGVLEHIAEELGSRSKASPLVGGGGGGGGARPGLRPKRNSC